MTIKLREIIAVGVVIILSLGVFAVDEPPQTLNAFDTYEAMDEDERRYLFDFCSGATFEEMEEANTVGTCRLAFNEF